MRTYAFVLPVICLVTAWYGCGSSEEAAQAPPPAPAPAEQAQQKLGFETRTDTVKTVAGAEREATADSMREEEIRFMVQIGAFKDPQLASALQGSARERHHMPVLNDFNTRLGLYQIRIGFFKTREEAQAFRQRLWSEFPAEYKDAWVVQLKR